ncbi:MAG TPA: glycosyltransferase family 2 protein [Candidatus Krumholzibacteria bacterium]|nr:glycosyltransferase family 2 protein [Candidatus Krumholzibacteria bacterium]
MWQFVFWGSLALLLYVYAGYPALLVLAGRVRRRVRSVPQAPASPSVCLIISAFDEERVIRQKIENSLRLEYDGELSIIVASDGSTDRTVAIVEDYRDLGVELFHLPVRRGKNAVLNDVIPARTEDVIVFTDANSLFAEDSVARLLERFADPAVGCVVGELSYGGDLTAAGQGESLYWRYEKWIKKLESRLGSVLVANGSIFAVYRRLVGPLFSDVANDLQVPFDVANQGLKIIYEPRALAAERSAELWSEEFDRKVRIVMRGVAGFTRLNGRVRGMRLWQFVSHKLLRWCVGLVLLVLLVATAVLAPRAAGYAAFLALQIVCYAAAFAGWRMRSRPHVPKLLYVPFYFAMVNYAAMVAMVRFASGGRQVVWEKAASTRLEPPAGERPLHANSGADVATVAVAESGHRGRLFEE